MNNFFSNIIKTKWISGTEIDKQREAEIQSYLSNQTEVRVAKEQDELDSLIETFKLRSRKESNDNDNVNNSFAEKKNWINLFLWTMFLVLLILQKRFHSFKEV